MALPLPQPRTRDAIFPTWYQTDIKHHQSEGKAPSGIAPPFLYQLLERCQLFPRHESLGLVTEHKKSATAPAWGYCISRHRHNGFTFLTTGLPYEPCSSGPSLIIFVASLYNPYVSRQLSLIIVKVKPIFVPFFEPRCRVTPKPHVLVSLYNYFPLHRDPSAISLIPR